MDFSSGTKVRLLFPCTPVSLNTKPRVFEFFRIFVSSDLNLERISISDSGSHPFRIPVDSIRKRKIFDETYCDY